MDNPKLLVMAFAQNGNKNAIQVTRQEGQDPNDATWSDGFPPVTMQPVESGGLPPKGLDFNGMLFDLSAVTKFIGDGGQVKFSAAHAESIGGYEKGATVLSDDETKSFRSLKNANKLNPNGATAQQMQGNWVVCAVNGIDTTLAGLASKTDVSKKADKATTLAGYGIKDGVSFIAAGKALPTSDIGPIWHEDYMSLMTWVSYKSNGANYDGYASIDIGNVTADSQATLRKGFLRAGAASYAQTSYPALWNWAKHNGLVKTSSEWAAKTGFYRDNGNGTFTPPDLSDQHIRFSGSGRDVGSYQGDAMRKITGRLNFRNIGPHEFTTSYEGAFYRIGQGPGGQFSGVVSSSATNDTGIVGFDSSRDGMPIASQVQVVTTAFLPAIKF